MPIILDQAGRNNLIQIVGVQEGEYWSGSALAPGTIEDTVVSQSQTR